MTSTKGEYPYYWNEDKNTALQQERDISFENIVEYIAMGGLLDIVDHPNTKDYPNQKILIIGHNDYAYYVPFVVQDDNTYFLKTIIPSRKYTKQYLS